MTASSSGQTRRYADGVMRWLQQRANEARPAFSSMRHALRSASRRRWRNLRDVCIALGWSPGPVFDRLRERAHARLTSAGERRRIERELQAYAKSGAAGIDLLRAAALWAGAGSERYALRQMRYRVLAAAIRRGEIRGAVQHGGKGPGPNAYTRLPLRELQNYLLRIGVLPRLPLK